MTVKNRSEKKSPLLLTGVFDGKKKTSARRVGAAKAKLKAIGPGIMF